ncbi:ABC transporter related protein [Caldicellulosiruptor saccharolyticus DSM 8903]|uniref:ABC-type quaternary amine transporter n=1 Tax=Caldicellulosiruptor saccharolyticus (strain ATCC 43494 / DSM 8903 / Tp8T 6331) TaxID=351627 RepID=A4XJY7_CALS8|nr:ABC transporter ATP-binding protein [Caldicellulosiruptor saccharolyticus]ABP67222.1 ABC transporter related protein [Caldicellulosiruptor saccharolyticus DSM 8903]
MALVIENVSKRFQSKNKEINVLEKINLEVQNGEFICILGPSGCGKSTLLNIIAGLEKPTEGKVFLNGREVLSPGPDRVVMFQESALFPWLKVIDNVEFGMKIRGVPKKERHERALKYLKMVHLTKFKDVYVHQLSGGMKQRVALARALTLDSEVLLMDEPFAALDSQTKNILLLELQRIWWETKKTIIFVTHNIEEAVLLADKVVVMSSNPGKIKKVFEIRLARPRLLDNPDIVYMISAIMKELKDEVEKIAKAEYDSDWSFEKDTVLYSSDSSLGIGL